MNQIKPNLDTFECNSIIPTVAVETGGIAVEFKTNRFKKTSYFRVFSEMNWQHFNYDYRCPNPDYPPN